MKITTPRKFDGIRRANRSKSFISSALRSPVKRVCCMKIIFCCAMKFTLTHHPMNLWSSDTPKIYAKRSDLSRRICLAREVYYCCAMKITTLITLMSLGAPIAQKVLPPVRLTHRQACLPFEVIFCCAMKLTLTPPPHRFGHQTHPNKIYAKHEDLSRRTCLAREVYYGCAMKNTTLINLIVIRRSK